jgi:predicted RNA-binding Zn-ribbon protein involved in translation (DUF1610 family)
VVNPSCPACGLRMLSSTVLDLLFSYGQQPGAAGLREILRREGNVVAFECRTCGLYACWA